MRPQTWVDALAMCQQSGQAYVLITVLPCAGSTPRTTGAKMVVTADETFDTVGGGHLEFEATKRARQALVEGKNLQHIEHYPLSSKLGQCCGGAMNLLFECFTEHCQTLYLFGAGHVSKALITILSQLPLHIKWIDNRPDMFDDRKTSTNVTCIVEDDPESLLDQAKEHDWVLIMTHDHQLDYTLAETALKHHACNYVGMIGSQTKAKRFVHRLKSRGLDEAQLNRFVCPVGLTEVPGKRPVEVAVSIAGQLIQHLHKNENVVADEKQQWKHTKELAKWLSV